MISVRIFNFEAILNLIKAILAVFQGPASRELSPGSEASDEELPD